MLMIFFLKNVNSKVMITPVLSNLRSSLRWARAMHTQKMPQLIKEAKLLSAKICDHPMKSRAGRLLGILLKV